MNVDEILDQAGLPEAEPDVEMAWATVSQRGQRRRTRRRALVGTCVLAVIAMVLGTFGWQRTSDDDDVNVAAEVENPRSASAGQMVEVTYRGVSFDVPSELPVSEPRAYEFQCLTYRADGVFLAPDGAPLGGASCPATFEYGRTIHVQPLNFDDPGDRTVEGEGREERWITGTEANQWYEVALPHYGLLFTFYELDEEVRETVLSSVRRGSDREPTAGVTPTEGAYEERCASEVGPDEGLVASYEGTGEYEAVCWIDGAVPKSPPPGPDGQPAQPFDRSVVGIRGDGSTSLIKAGYQGSMPPEPP